MKFSTMFHRAVKKKYKSTKVNNKTQSLLIKWDNQSSEELVSISYFLLL